MNGGMDHGVTTGLNTNGGIGAEQGLPELRMVGTSAAHESAVAHVTGHARYIDDLPEFAQTLYAAPILSPVACGELHHIDIEEALAVPGVVRVLTAADVGSENYIASPLHDEPIFVDKTISYAGQVLGLVVADSVGLARRVARKIKLEISERPACGDVWQAVAEKQFVLPPVHVERGNAQEHIRSAPVQLEGEFSVGGQEHFYLEGQIAYAIGQEQNHWLIYSSTQHPGEVQHWVAHALGVHASQVRVECRRMGGGFGGKETQAGQPAVWAALAAKHCGRPVKLRLDRDDDFRITGKRHPFHYRYRVGADAEGKILGLVLEMAVDCGFSADLSGPVADRAIFHCDNTYFLEHLSVDSYRCRTNRQSHTAFRGFGGPQGMMAIETILGDVARACGCDPLDVRLRNLYGKTERNITHYQMRVEDNIAADLLAEIERTSDYRARRKAIAGFNQQSAYLKRGIAITPVKFGISFTATQFNQAGALVHVYTDGSVLVNHGGTEMGQGLHTKVLQVVAETLGLDLKAVRISASDTDKVPNASATAASSGADLNAMAAQGAALQIRDRLSQWYAQQVGVDPKVLEFRDAMVVCTTTPQYTLSFAELVRKAYAARIQLWSDGFYATPKIHYDKKTLTGRPFFYFSYGVACSEVEIDTRTGALRLRAVDILHDVGSSLNPALDRGQVEGGFIQGVGWLTTEELFWDAKGVLKTQNPSTYKIPATSDIPEHFNVQFWLHPNAEDTIYHSKAVGEPPFMLAISVWEAARDAIGQLGDRAVQLDAPLTPERVFFAVRRQWA